MIKPEFWTSRTLTGISRDARLMFIGLWNFADDFGVLDNSNRRIMGNLFPYDELVTEQEIQKWKDELVISGLLVKIEHLGHSYLFIKSWAEHQKVDHKGKETVPTEIIIETLARVSRESSETLDRKIKREIEIKREISSNEDRASLETLKEIRFDPSLSDPSPTPQVPERPPPPKTYGNKEITQTLEFLKKKVQIDDFKNTAEWQRRYAKNCMALAKKLNENYPPGEFFRRLDVLLQDKFISKQLNDIKKLYEEIKGFKEPESKTLEL